MVFFVNFTDSRKMVGRVTTSTGVAFWNLDDEGCPVDPCHSEGAEFTVR
ncbi:MAG: hypothetical protein HRU37_14860 [Roseibacillus sp.]|jgi:hypothetical protein|nr:hypothetical protein [Roseibacillus sp.]